MQRDIDAREKDAARKLTEWEAAAKTAKEKGKPEPEKPDTDDVQGIAEMVAHLLASWDVTDGGKPLPITVDTLVDSLGYIYTIAILRAILSDITAGTEPTDPNSAKAA